MGPLQRKRRRQRRKPRRSCLHGCRNARVQRRQRIEWYSYLGVFLNDLFIFLFARTQVATALPTWCSWWWSLNLLTSISMHCDWCCSRLLEFSRHMVWLDVQFGVLCLAHCHM